MTRKTDDDKDDDRDGHDAWDDDDRGDYHRDRDED